MGDTPSTTDATGFFNDDGGSIFPGFYSNQLGQPPQQFTICPPNAGCVIMDFSSFITENSSNLGPGDVLYIYDGPDTSSDVIGAYSGSLLSSENAFGQVFAGSGCMTFVFDENGGFSTVGWAAEWTSFTSTCITRSTLDPPVDCETAILVCDEETLNYNSNGPGVEELISQGINGCISSGETQSAWFVININQFAPFNVPLEFTLSPKSGGEDYDFAVYGPVDDCENLGFPIRCTYAEETFAGTLLTGLRAGETDVSESPTVDSNGGNANGFVQPIVVNPGETYYIMVNNFSTNNVGFDLFWGDAVSDNNLLDCSVCDFAAIMPDDFSVCQGESFQLPISIFKGSGFFSYVWSSDDPVNFTGENPVTVTLPLGFSGEVVVDLLVIDTQVNNCEREGSVTIDVQSDFQYDGISIDPELCPGEVTDVELLGTFGSNSTITWNLGNANISGGDLTTTGPLQLSWDTPGNKFVTAFIEQGDCPAISFPFQTKVLPIIGTPTVMCPTIPSDSTFTWTPVTGAISYTVTVLVNGVQVNQFNTSNAKYTVLGAQGEEVEIIVIANHGNGYCDGVAGSVTCTILGCELPADFGILGLSDAYCVENPAVTLAANPPGGTFTIGDDEVTTFDPAQGEGEYIIQYTLVDDVLGCIYIAEDTVSVLAAITGDFAVTDSICTDGFATIQYTGNAGADADYSWTFGGGTASTTSGPGPIEVTWNGPGFYPITLFVSANGCDSGVPIPEFVTVIQTPTAPVLSCDEADLGCASVSWTAEAGHSYFIEAFVNSSSIPVSSPISGGNFSQCGLEDGDTLLVNVYAEINGQNFCGSTETVTIECIVSTCQETTLSILGLDESYCLGDQVIEITTEPTGGTLSSPSAGLNGSTFTIADAGVGEHTITYVWEDEIGCLSDTTFTTTIYDIPTASFTINPNPICEGGGATITYDGTTGVENYEWDFGEDLITIPPSGPGPHPLVWGTSGTKTITLIVTANGCPSEIFSADLDIIPQPQVPVISCGPSTEDCVTFEWTTSPGDDGYTFSLAITPPGGSTMIQTGLSSATNSYTVCDLEPGTEVRINGLRAIAFTPCTNSAAAPAFICNAIDCNETLTINGLPNTICADGAVVNFNFVAPVGATISGNGVTQNSGSTASFNPATAGVGIHTISLDYTDPDTNCPPYNETAQIQVFGVPTASFNIAGGTTTFCVGQPVSFTFNGSAGIDSYNWNFGTGASPSTSVSANPPAVSYNSAGTKTITLQVNDNGCIDNVNQDITIVAPLATPTVICDNTDQTSVTFGWGDIAGSTGYSISYSIDSGPAITDNLTAGTTTYTVSPLTPGQSVAITVIALGNDPCGNSQADTHTCVAQDCPTVNPQITGLNSEYCDDCGNAITLTATPAGGTFTINGSPATTFDPCGLSGTFTIDYEYIQGACTYNAPSQQVTVNTRPTADLAVSAIEACIGDAVDVSFTGTAGATANYNWNFGAGATPATANTVGPHSISWTTGGTKTITLNLDENNCTATAATTTVEVSAPLVAPTISCTGSTENSVGFGWNDVGGTGEFVYDVYLNGNLDLSAQSTFGTIYDRAGLTPGDEVRIVVYAIGNPPCGDSPTNEQTCFAENCPTLTPTIDNLNAAYCQDAGIIPLTATNTGGNGTGTGEFTLNNVVITEFDTNQSPGNYTINYTYTQGSCSGSTSAIVTIDELPQADIAALADACISEQVDVTYSGTAPAGANYTWDFGVGAIPPTQTGEGPWQVAWDGAGTKTISVTVELNGCQDNTSITLEVIEPLVTPTVTCTEVTQNLITFGWDNVAASYNVSVIVNSIPTFDDPAFVGETYTASGLVPGDEVSIVVEPLGGAPCGNGIAGATSCIAADCPDLALNIVIDNTEFCLDEQGSLLSATPEGGSFTINNDPTPVGDFNPALTGVGTHTIYYNYTNPDTGCPYVDSLEVNVFELPTADFDLALQACPNESITLDFTGLAPNTSDSGFNWGNFNGANILSGLGSGPYELSWAGTGTKTINLQVTTDNGCTASIEQIIEITEVSIDMPTTLTINQGDSIQIVALANSSTSDLPTYIWDNIETLSCSDCFNPVATPEITTTYTLNVVDEDGCDATQSVVVNVIIPEPVPQLTVSNAFSPNGDGMNDVFRPIFDEMTTGITIQIYNRWGEMVFESSDRNAYWDGTYKDEVVPVGVYVYWMIVDFSNGDSRLLTGNVTVIR
ncbi:MAG: PKD domain-containing protein [Chitinophagales bacterium]